MSLSCDYWYAMITFLPADFVHCDRFDPLALKIKSTADSQNKLFQAFNLIPHSLFYFLQTTLKSLHKKLQEQHLLIFSRKEQTIIHKLKVCTFTGSKKNENEGREFNELDSF